MTNAEARFNKSHIRKVYACLAVTCHLHFWQNDRDFLRATVVTRGWNGYRNKSRHRKSTLEKKILPPLQQGFEPATFQSRVRHNYLKLLLLYLRQRVYPPHYARAAVGCCWWWRWRQRNKWGWDCGVTTVKQIPHTNTLMQN